jgi:hypothetical protein
MRILLLISIFLIAGCKSSEYLMLEKTTANSSCLDKFRPEITTILYNTHINVVGNHLSGLLLFKKMPDSTTRVLFSNEMGVKFFDFEFTKDNFHVIYCMKKLNKKAVIGELKKDIGLLIFHNMDTSKADVMKNGNELYFGFKSGKERNYYITTSDCTDLIKIENAAKGKKKVVLALTDYKAGLPDSVYISHEKFEFNISLKQIER